MKNASTIKDSIITIGLVILLSVILLAVFYYAMPQYYTGYIFLIPVFFLFLAVFLLFISWIVKKRKVSINHSMQFIMSYNTAQLLLSIGFMLFYAYFININTNPFLISFGLFYLLFMGIKYYIFNNMDYKTIKNEYLENEKN
jgi:hypothetical protein